MATELLKEIQSKIDDKVDMIAAREGQGVIKAFTRGERR